MPGEQRLPLSSNRRLLASGAVAAALCAAALAATRMAGAAVSLPQPVLLPPVAAAQLAPIQPTALPTATDPLLIRKSGLVGEDLSRSLDAAGISPAVARDFIKAIGQSDPERLLSVADRFDLVIANEPGGAPLLVYAGLDRVGRADIQMFKWGDGRRVQWLDAAGSGRDSGGMAMPVGGRVTSRFGGRMHPILGAMRMHKGVDLAAAWGAPIAAAADGRVEAAGWRGGYGQQVAIAHGGGLETSYSHMSRIAARVGETVHRGQVIGYVGATGLATGPHLHFEVHRGGRPVDPMTARLSVPFALDGDRLHAFHDQLRFVLTMPRA